MSPGILPFSVAFVVALSAIGASAGPLQQAMAGEKELTNLVMDLGSESWSRRENAQSRILEAGLPLASRLEKAALSGNLELSYRAKYLLSRIDPSIIQCQTVKLWLDPTPRIASVAAGSGEEGAELSVRPLLPGAGGKADRTKPTAGYAEDPSYFIHCRQVLSPGDEARTPEVAARIVVTASQVTAGASRMELKPLISTPNCIRILRSGEQCLHRRLGLQIERERFRFVTLLRLRSGRRSLVGELALPSSQEEALERLVDQLVEQGQSRDPESRRDALEILGLLRPRKAAPLFREALKRESDRAFAALGLDDPALLRATIGMEAPLDLQFRAAARLLERGDEQGLDFLLARLSDADPALLHPVMAAVADYCRTGAASGPARERISRAVLSDDFLGHTIWEDVETEYLLGCAASLIHPAVDAERALLVAGMDSMQRLTLGELGPVNVRLRTSIDVWRRLAERLAEKPVSDADFILDVLPSLKGAASITEAVTLLEASLGDGSLQPRAGLPGQVSDGDLTRIIDGVLIHVRSGEPDLSEACCQALLRISRALTLGPGQLRRVVSAFIDVGEATLKAQSQDPQEPQRTARSSSAALRQLEDQLAKWTALQPARRSAGATAFSPETWKAWLEDENLVEAREKELEEARSKAASSRQASGAAEAGGEAPPALVFYELELLLSGTGAPGARVDGASRRFQVIDGRRLELTPSTPVAFKDRWGNRLALRVEKDGAAAHGQPQRFRVNSRFFLFTGLPSLTTVETRVLSLTWHETSDGFLGSRMLPGGGSSNYRSLYLLDFLGLDPPSPPSNGDPEALWAWFLENRLLKIPPDAAPQQLNGILGIFRTLGIKECAPLLREVLKVKPTIDVALQLLEIGDESGLAFLRSELASGAPLARLLAASALCEAGLNEGVDALIDFAEKNAAAVKIQGWRIANALDAFLTRAQAPETAKAKALEFLLGHLDESGFQPKGFVILTRESGTDFGFDGARGLNDLQERTRTIQKCVRDAREWWETRKTKK